MKIIPVHIISGLKKGGLWSNTHYPVVNLKPVDEMIKMKLSLSLNNPSPLVSKY